MVRYWWVAMPALKVSQRSADGNTRSVEVKYTGDLKYARWTMHPGGWVSLDYEYNLTGAVPLAGISFSYPENFVLGAKWLGKGPYRVWKNRLQGVGKNVWENMYNNTQTGSYPWNYPGVQRIFCRYYLDGAEYG